MNYHNIPAELRALNQWVVAGPSKAPLNPYTGQLADPTDRSTWGTYEEALRAGYLHIGFVLSKDDPYAIIDLDDPFVRSDKTPIQETDFDYTDALAKVERHQKILEATSSYAEYSQSGKGVHIVVKGAIPHGVRRDKVEVYSDTRYMIFTGDVLNAAPIVEEQELLDILYNEMVSTWEVELEEVSPQYTDEVIKTRAMGAENGWKFKTLWEGDFSDYPSQSEADMALMSILCFYSRSNDQCRRLFEQSGLYRGNEKTNKRGKYMDYMLKKIRAKELPLIDITELLNNAHELLHPTVQPANAHDHPPTGDRSPPKPPAPRPPAGRVLPKADQGVAILDNGKTRQAPPPPPQGVGSSSEIEYPPGFIGDLARHFLASAVRPVPEIALISSIALLAGVVGRSYNISETGLNQYIILIAETGTGKEGIASGINKLISEVRKTVPAANRFMGPARFASGQALVKVISKRPCLLSVLGEFGITLQRMTDPRAPDSMTMLKGVLLDLYGKSGFEQIMMPSAYSDSEKDTAMVQAPNLSILGESTPQEFYGKLDASQVMSGLIPRFMVVEYKGKRPPLNKQRGKKPSEALVNTFADLLTLAITTEQNNTCCPIQLDAGAESLLDEFELETTATINGGATEFERHLWNRAHLKAMKLAGLVAVGVDPQQPVVTTAIVKWALDFVRREVNAMARRYATGDVGEGQSKQEHDLRRAIDDYLHMKVKERAQYKIAPKVIGEPLVPYGYLRRRLRMCASFKNDRAGFAKALDITLDAMVKAGDLVMIPALQARDLYDLKSPVYGIGASY